MDVLESPLEALAFNYASFGFFTVVNSLWTWVAVLTAAVSYWRIRALGFHSHPHKSDPPPSFPDPNSDGSRAPLQLTPFESSSELSSACKWDFSVEHDRSTKGKFTLYYDADRETNGETTLDGNWDDAGVGVETVDDVDGGCLDGETCESWEGLILMKRMGDLGCYHYQDLTVLNGSVVRLWDCNRRRSSPSGLVLW